MCAISWRDVYKRQVCARTVDLRELDHVVDFGAALGTLPLRDGLTGNPKQVRQLLLRIAGLAAKVEQTIG